MAWHRPGDKLLSEPMMISLPTQICVTRPQWVIENDVSPQNLFLHGGYELFFTFIAAPAERRRLCLHICWYVGLSVSSITGNWWMDFHWIFRICWPRHKEQFGIFWECSGPPLWADIQEIFRIRSDMNQLIYTYIYIYIWGGGGSPLARLCFSNQARLICKQWHMQGFLSGRFYPYFSRLYHWHWGKHPYDSSNTCKTTLNNMYNWVI